MVDITAEAATTFRDFEVDFVSGSGVHKPDKGEIRALFGDIDAAIDLVGAAVTLGSVVVKKTVALLNADTAHPDTTLGIVWDDPTSANNGVYVLSLTSPPVWTLTNLNVPGAVSAYIQGLETSAAASAAAAAASDADAIVQVGLATTQVSLATAQATAAAGSALAAQAAEAAVISVAELSGIVQFFDTKADATAGLAGIPANGVVEVFVDESASNHRTLYQKQSGVLVQVADLDLAASLLGIYHNLAALTAATVPSSVHLVLVQNFSASVDGGRGYYRKLGADPGHAGKTQSADGAWWELLPESKGINATALGAVGDGSTSCDTAHANAIGMARLIGCKAIYFPGATSAYKHTLSLNYTFATQPAFGLRLVGDGARESILDFSAMSEAYPCVDFSGNTNGELCDIQIRITGSASLAKCGFLGSQPSAHAGNNLHLNRVWINIPWAGGNANMVAGTIIASCDLSILDHVQSTGPIGFNIGAYRPAGITSKFQTLSSSVDWTQCTMRDCIGSGSTGAALRTSGSIVLVGINYFALVAPGTGLAVNAGIIDLSTEGHSDSNNHSLEGYLRTENQSGSTASVFNLLVNAGAWNLMGTTTTDAAGFLFTGTGSLSGSRFAVQGASKIFNGILVKDVLLDNNQANTFGTVAAGSFGITITSGGITQTMLAGQQDYDLRRNDGTRHKSNETQLYQKSCTAPMLQIGGLAPSNPSLTAYTGGSGEHEIFSWVLPANLLTATVGGRLPTPVTYKLRGYRAGGALGRVRLLAVQGTNNAVIYDSSAALPASTGTFFLNLEFFNAAIDSLFCFTSGKINTVDANTTGAANLGRGGVSVTADITISLRITDVNSSPVVLNQLRGQQG